MGLSESVTHSINDLSVLLSRIDAPTSPRDKEDAILGALRISIELLKEFNSPYIQDEIARFLADESFRAAGGMAFDLKRFLAFEERLLLQLRVSKQAQRLLLELLQSLKPGDTGKISAEDVKAAFQDLQSTLEADLEARSTAAYTSWRDSRLVRVLGSVIIVMDAYAPHYLSVAPPELMRASMFCGLFALTGSPPRGA